MQQHQIANIITLCIGVMYFKAPKDITTRFQNASRSAIRYDMLYCVAVQTS